MTHTQNLSRVKDWENENVNGAALRAKHVHEDNLAEIAALRKRQEAYHASLPKDPLDALAAINASLSDLNCYADAQYAPRAALEIIQLLARNGVLDGEIDLRKPIYWLTSQALDGLEVIEQGSERARDIAGQFSLAPEFKA